MDSQGAIMPEVSDMMSSSSRKALRLLVLGGTTEASRLAEWLAGQAGIDATLSLAGRTAEPKLPPIAWRMGGFGGSEGLCAYLAAESIDLVIDATHPFAAQMSRNACLACARSAVPLLAIERPAWQAGPEDRWIGVQDMQGAVAALGCEPKRIFLGVGRLSLPVFEQAPQHTYMIRVIDRPEKTLILPHMLLIEGRGPFKADDDAALFEKERIDIIVSKNSGGTGAFAKIEAARRLKRPVVMVHRPAMPDRESVTDLAAAIAWIEAFARNHAQSPSTKRGV
jgi:precorrin-6A/cobalt-precorrin-6A reductase